MKKILCYIFIITAIGFGQNLSVVGTEHISLGKNGDFSFPQFSPDGSKILFTQSGLRGLWLYDLSDKSTIQLNDYIGAGYEPKFTADGKQVIFRTDEYIQKRRYSSLAIQAIGDKKIQYLTEKMRHLSPAILLSSDRLVYRVNEAVKSVSLNNNKSVQTNIANETFGYIDNRKIIIQNNGVRKELVPIENRDYVWFSLSPNKSEFVFTVVGGSTFISDINGNILTELGKANAPKWSPDGKWILYMVDEDDGHVITSSDVWAYNLEKETRFQLTKTNDIHEMYPAWSPKMDKVVCEVNSGNIVIIDIRIDG